MPQLLLFATHAPPTQAAIAVNPKGGGPSQLVVYAVTSKKMDAATLKRAFQTSIKVGTSSFLRKHTRFPQTTLNPLFRVTAVMPVEKLPRTASNKVMRRTLRDWYKKKMQEEADAAMQAAAEAVDARAAAAAAAEETTA
jgi:acyl-coenzyme A synthetase/AMP-(fatty) acid ligase